MPSTVKSEVQGSVGCGYLGLSLQISKYLMSKEVDHAKKNVQHDVFICHCNYQYPKRPEKRNDKRAQLQTFQSSITSATKCIIGVRKQNQEPVLRACVLNTAIVNYCVTTCYGRLVG